MPNDHEVALKAAAGSSASSRFAEESWSPSAVAHVEALIDARSIGAAQYRVLLLCFVISMLDGFDLASMALAVPLVAADWHVAPGAFAMALSASLAGLGVGSAVCGSLGDRYGRRPLVLMSCLVVGAGSLCTVLCADLNQLFWCRLFTGIGFGMAMPNVYALVSDVMPRRVRALLVTALASAVSVGGLIAGATGPGLARQWGWEGIFVAGGVMTLTLGGCGLLWLSESPKYLAGPYGDVRKLAAVLLDLAIADSGGGDGGKDVPPCRADPLAFVRSPFLLPTFFFATIWAVNGFVFYLLSNWLPTIVAATGVPMAAAMQSLSYLYGGAIVGGLFMSWLMDRSGIRYPMVVAVAYGLSAATFASVAWLDSSMIVRPWLFCMIGLTVGGGQYICPGLGARLYPPMMLASALGWIGAMSRFGAVLGPMVGGWLLMSGRSVTSGLSLMAIPALACLAAAVMLAITAPKERG
jgi:AAHS family 4-hydroxybenzoate transporter-like MFS transporter